MGKARAITYQTVPDPGTKIITGDGDGTGDAGDKMTPPAVLRESVQYHTGLVYYYHYAEYTGWDTDPELIIIYCPGGAFQAPGLALGQWSIDAIHEQCKAAIGGTTSVIQADYRGAPLLPGTQSWADLIEIGDIIKTDYGASQPFTYAGHSAGGHIACKAAHHHGVPWLAINGIFDFGSMSNTGNYADDFATCVTNLSDSTMTAPDYLDSWNVDFSTSSPPGYIIYSTADDQVHNDCSEDAAARLKNLGVYHRVDQIQAASPIYQTDHYCTDEINVDGVRDWYDWLRDGYVW